MAECSRKEVGMAMKGWRRIGIIVSVIWFLGLWRLSLESVRRGQCGPLRARLKDLFSD